MATHAEIPTTPSDVLHPVGKRLPLGATYLGNRRCAFSVWAPQARKVEVQLLGPQGRRVSLNRDPAGYHQGTLEGVVPGALYLYRLDAQKERPDPASRSQPRGVHGPSQVVDPGAFAWRDAAWRGLPQRELVIYELHVGTFTPEGTFDGVVGRLDGLKELGVTAVELMPVAQFPGQRNWGYDGVLPFAVQDSYGGPEGLRRLVDACHRRGLAVILDVVYNHLGPEGNYLADFGPYFTDRYRTPWGLALNFDGPQSDHVRRFFIENALHWVREYHVDGLRLDAVHAIVDPSARPFVAELAETVQREAQQLGRRVWVIAETDRNDSRILLPREMGGYGLDGQWNDDFHHALHALLTGERSGYYQDFGAVAHLVRAFTQAYVYTGQYSRFRERRHGNRPRLARAEQFVVFAQNHDQVGNRMKGERMGHLVSLSALKLAAGAVLLSPFVPLLFMGEEYAEEAPFQYFTSHSDPELVAAVRRGRREEFADFHQAEGEVPDPQDEATFARSRLHWEMHGEGGHGILRGFYRHLLRMRRERPALAESGLDQLECTGCECPPVMTLRRWAGDDEVMALLSFGREPAAVTLPVPPGRWRKELDSEMPVWGGSGSPAPAELRSEGTVTLSLAPQSLVLYGRIPSDPEV